MNYYSHHIGDYLTDTAHLSILEDGAYRRLMDRYYTSEAPLTADENALFRLLRARSDDEKDAIRIVLAEFFTLTDDGWSHKRCDAEIAAYKDKSVKAADAANKRWNKPSNADAMPTHNERIADALPTNPNNQEPLTNNQEPLKTKDAPSASVVDIRPKQSLPDWLPEKAWNDWVSFKGKKLTAKAKQLNLKTLTDLHAAGHDPTAVIEQSIERGWTGLFPLKTNSSNGGRKTPALENFKEKAYVGTDEAAIDWMR